MLQVDHAEPHQDEKPVFRSDFTGAGRLPATERTSNSMQIYSTDDHPPSTPSLSATVRIIDHTKYSCEQPWPISESVNQPTAGELRGRASGEGDDVDADRRQDGGGGGGGGGGAIGHVVEVVAVAVVVVQLAVVMA